jgi:predicted nucleic acid-binding protein
LTGKRSIPVKAFFDKNVLIYAVAEGDPRSVQAEELLTSGGVLSVQVLNEFVSEGCSKLEIFNHQFRAHNSFGFWSTWGILHGGLN